MWVIKFSFCSEKIHRFFFILFRINAECCSEFTKISPKSDMIRTLGRKKFRMKRFWIIAEVVCYERPGGKCSLLSLKFNCKKIISHCRHQNKLQFKIIFWLMKKSSSLWTFYPKTAMKLISHFWFHDCGAFEIFILYMLHVLQMTWTRSWLRKKWQSWNNSPLPKNCSSNKFQSKDANNCDSIS